MVQVLLLCVHSLLYVLLNNGEIWYRIKKNVCGVQIMAERNVKFQYFGIVEQRKEGNKWKGYGKWDLEAWLDIVDKKDLAMKAIDLGDIKARLEKVKYFETNNVWVLRFMKLREDNIPSIVKENKEAKGIPLADDEYIGEDLYLLYDAENGVGMVQVNRFSLGLKRVEEFLTQIWSHDGERIRLKPIIEDFDLEKVRGRRKYRSIEVKFANISNQLDEDGNSLGTIMNSFRRLSGVSGNIKIGLGNTKYPTLDIDEVQNLIHDSLEDASVVGLKVKVKDDDTRPVEEIDLFDNICSSIITFHLAKKTVLNYEYASLKMRENYMAKKDNILRLLYGRE